MPANTAPIFTLLPEVTWSTNMIAANTGNLSGGTTNNYPVFTGGTNGSYLQKIRFRHQSTNVSNTAATVARVFINNGGVVTNPNNNTLFDEITIAANTVSQTAASTNYELPLNFAIPVGYIIYVTLGTAPTAGTGIQATIVGGDY
jgi:hypothetical protein